MNTVTLNRWQETPQLSVANGAFSRALSQPQPHHMPKQTIEPRGMNASPPPVAAFGPAAQSGNVVTQNPGPERGNIANSMQADVASALSGAISHGVRYDAKTCQSLGGTPQYLGTSFGNAIDQSREAEKFRLLESFDYGNFTILNIQKAFSDQKRFDQKGGRDTHPQSRYFDWHRYYQARLFSRIMERAPVADHRAGLVKSMALDDVQHLGGYGYETALQDFLDAITYQNRNSGMVGFDLISFDLPQGIRPFFAHKKAKQKRIAPPCESFWDIYGCPD